ncbi:MAG: sigma factor-like helix-turn-helix DNA-binding protein [Verrucomicrobiota bacterium]
MTKNLVKTQQKATGPIGSRLLSLDESEHKHPCDILQLSVASLNGLKRGGISNLGEIIEAWHSGEIHKRKRFGGKVPIEVPDRLETLQRHIDPPSRKVSWTRFAHDPSIGGILKLYITGPEFDRLRPEDLRRDIGALHLSRAHLLLRKFEVYTIEHFIRFFEHGPPENLPGIGKSKLQEIEESAQRLSLAIKPDGFVDWIQFANDLGYEILPKKKEMSSDKALVQCLPGVALRVGALTCEDRGVEIAKDRLLSSREERPTLEEISQRYGITRERVRQLEDVILTGLRDGLFRSSYEQMPFRFREELEATFQRTRDHFAAFGTHIWKLPDWLNELSQFWKVPERFVNQYATLFTELFEFESVISSNPRLPPTLFPPNLAIAARDRQHRRMKAVEKALKQATKPLSPEEILEAANRQLDAEIAIQTDQFHEVVQFSPHLDFTSDGRFEFRFSSLSVARQAARILKEANQPLHLSALREKILELHPESPIAAMKAQNLGKRLAYLNELTAVGRTGFWAHQSWKSQKQPTLTELAQAALQESGEPLRSIELLQGLPPWKRYSIKTVRQELKKEPARFASHNGDSWSLSEWNEGAPDLSSVELTAFLQETFANANHPEGLAFKTLQNALIGATGLSIRNAKKALRFHPALDLRLTDDSWMTHFNQLADENLTPPRQRGRWPSCTKDVHEWLHQQFDEAGTDVLPLIDLAQGIEAELDLALATGYSVIRKSAEFETEGGKRFRMCRRVVSPDRGKIPTKVSVRTTTQESDTTLAH